MFDIGFSELLLFGVIALIVLGPEKLPQAARTAGQWYAKIRRTVSTLQSEIEAELDLAETRQLMQKELAKIRQTEAEMKREMAEMRGSMREFEHSQNQNLKSPNVDAISRTQDDTNKTTEDPNSKLSVPAAFNYAYGQNSALSHESDAINLNNDETQNNLADDVPLASNSNSPPIMTRPWESMWFRLGDYDRARRLPAAPLLPNYKADILLYNTLDNPSSSLNHKAER